MVTEQTAALSMLCWFEERLFAVLTEWTRVARGSLFSVFFVVHTVHNKAKGAGLRSCKITLKQRGGVPDSEMGSRGCTVPLCDFGVWYCTFRIDRSTYSIIISSRVLSFSYPVHGFDGSAQSSCRIYPSFRCVGVPFSKRTGEVDGVYDIHSQPFVNRGSSYPRDNHVKEGGAKYDAVSDECMGESDERTDEHDGIILE